MTFSELATYFTKLEGTASRITITQILADLFRRSHGSEIRKICYILQGRVVPLYEAVEFGVADKFMIRAIASAYGVPDDRVAKSFKKHGDLGLAAQEFHKGSGSLSVSDVFSKLDELARFGGKGSQEKKIGVLADLFRNTDAASARYLARIPLDKLRLGFSDVTILDGLSWMISGDKSLRTRLEDAYNVRPDIGYIAQTLKEKGIAGLARVNVQVGAPILAALCQRLPTADDMITKMGTVAVEPKYDGVRVQIHFSRGTFVRTFSRNLENTTAMFPELAEAGEELSADSVILDSEAVGVDPKSGKLISFQETMTRKRKHDIEHATKNVPLRFFVFDILYKDGKELLGEPLSKRREILKRVLQPKRLFVLSPQIVTDSPATLRAFHDQQLAKGLEGAVVKKWDSLYEPGRKGYHWVKFKEEEGHEGKLTDTIDAVIMGYSRGEGKRAGFGIGMFLVGVRSGERFVTITKIGTGVSDAMWKQLRTALERIRVSGQPKEYEHVNKLFIPDVWVTPKLVVEIAGDDLTKSPTHGAGVAVRFPRLVRLRDDKSPAQATTVAELRAMYRNQKSKA